MKKRKKQSFFTKIVDTDINKIMDFRQTISQYQTYMSKNILFYEVLDL